MRTYKVSLTTGEGELIDQWTLITATSAEMEKRFEENPNDETMATSDAQEVGFYIQQEIDRKESLLINVLEETVHG